MTTFRRYAVATAYRRMAAALARRQPSTRRRVGALLAYLGCALCP
ncbi:DUF2065 family protein [Catellatospora sichuanensis]|nr:DUF2065 family protein [Catellatospora sichuanensis]